MAGMSPQHASRPQLSGAYIAGLIAVVGVGVLVGVLIYPDDSYSPQAHSHTSYSAVTLATPQLSVNSQAITALPTTTAPAPVIRPTAVPTVYTVKPGDDLTVIAAWFHIRSLQAFYRANLATVGPDWNLIRPGQRLRLTIGM